ncbi:MAG: FAD/NAD(P)-binding oxidoreductase [Spirochaetia bacterium]|jgi:hypothetical protein
MCLSSQSAIPPSPGRKVAVLDDGTEMPRDLFLGVPVHRVPKVIESSGLGDGGRVPVNSITLETRFPGVYAVGDVTSVGAPKAGVFAARAARVAAAGIIARLRGGPKLTGAFKGQSAALAAKKSLLGSSRIQRWFGRSWKATRPCRSSAGKGVNCYGAETCTYLAHAPRSLYSIRRDYRVDGDERQTFGDTRSR